MVGNNQLEIQSRLSVRQISIETTGTFQSHISRRPASVEIDILIVILKQLSGYQSLGIDQSMEIDIQFSASVEIYIQADLPSGQSSKFLQLG